MFKDLFIQSGLNSNEATIYEYLLQNGESAAQDIEKATPLKKGVVYVALNDLVEKGLVTQKLLPPKNPNVRNKKKIAYFTPEHPEKLRNHLLGQENSIKKAQKNLEANFNDIISAFALVSSKPGVRYFEGKKGVFDALNSIINNFTPDSEIISFVKVLSNEFEKDTNAAFSNFIQKRRDMNVRTRVLALDAPESRELKQNDSNSLRETRLVQIKKFPFDFNGGEIFIYNDEIFSMTMAENKYSTVIIHSKSIAQLLRVFFEAEWELLAASL